MPQGAVKPSTAAKPPSSIPTTTESDVTRPSAWYERMFEGAGPTVTTKSTTTTKTPGAPSGTTQQPVTVHMQSPDGKTYSVNQSDVEASKAHGWKVIGG